MAATSIEWCARPGTKPEVWNPVTGCTKVSAGCKHCYAETIANRFWAKQYPPVPTQFTSDGRGLPYGGRPRRFTDVMCHEERLEAPFRWLAPRTVFVNSMSDLFHEDVPDGFLVRVWVRMLTSQMHTFLVLTKRPRRMLEFVARWNDLSGEPSEPQLVRGPEETRRAHPSGRGQLFADMLEAMGEPPDGCAFPTFDWMDGPRWWPTLPPLNVWLGVSAENQATADERIPLLLETPAAVRFVSAEPLLGPIDLGDDFWESGNRVDWVIAGGESGPGARPCDVAWIRSILDQCSEADVPCFVKQLGALPIRFAEGETRHTALGLEASKGSDPTEWPEDLRVRQWPTGGVL